MLIGVSQIGASDVATKAQMVPQGRPGIETRFDVTQTFPISQLGETQRQKMIINGEPTRWAGQRMERGTPRESLRMKAGDHLGENRAEKSHHPSCANPVSKSITCFLCRKSRVLKRFQLSKPSLAGQQ
jgi:hypothetical protein